MAQHDKLHRDIHPATYRPLILQSVVGRLTPFVMIYGIYILFNGHISPGGGFSGGTILGAGLVLCSVAFGSEKVRRFFSYNICMRFACSALAFYTLIKAYAFIVGAAGGSTGIPLGTPGDIFSGGKILPLNISIGIVVACTIYCFYALFFEGEV